MALFTAVIACHVTIQQEVMLLFQRVSYEMGWRWASNIPGTENNKPP
jgi:hypothetical protein